MFTTHDTTAMELDEHDVIEGSGTMAMVQAFYAAARRARKHANDTWVQVDGFFKQIHERMGPVDADAVRRRDALYEHLKTNSIEARALLEVLKELDPTHARDVAMAVEADVRVQWAQPEVKASRMSAIRGLQEP